MLESGHSSIPVRTMLLFKNFLIALLFGSLEDLPELAFIGGNTLGYCSLALILADVGPRTLDIRDTSSIDGSRISTLRL